VGLRTRKKRISPSGAKKFLKKRHESDALPKPGGKERRNVAFSFRSKKGKRGRYKPKVVGGGEEKKGCLRFAGGKREEKGQPSRMTSISSVIICREKKRAPGRSGSNEKKRKRGLGKRSLERGRKRKDPALQERFFELRSMRKKKKVSF